MDLGDLLDKYNNNDGIRIPEWIKLLENKRIAVNEISLNYGDLLQDSYGSTTRLDNCRHTLGVILSGRAELVDVIPTDFDVLAYRPIRIFEPGDIFGEFNLLDKFNGIKKVDYHFETWSLIAGRHCLIPCEEEEKNEKAAKNKSKDRSSDKHRKLYFEKIKLVKNNNVIWGDYPYYKHYLSNEYIDIASEQCISEKSFVDLDAEKNEVTKIALLDVELSDIESNKDSAIELHKIGWQRVLDYRASVNSFNWNSLMAFRALVKRTAQKNFTQNKVLLDSIADAIMDALNRPIRGEPCYHWMNKKMLVASGNFNCDAFYFPIDLHNYFIASGLHHAFEGRRPAQSPKNDIIGLFSNKSLESTSSQIRGLIDAVIAIFLEKNKSYPYEVTSIKLKGASRGMLLLKFKKKS
jgi:hypothetical protein